jgi:hypothetical protein
MTRTVGFEWLRPFEEAFPEEVDRGPSEDPTDTRSAQTDIEAQDAVEMTQGAQAWNRTEARRA